MNNSLTKANIQSCFDRTLSTSHLHGIFGENCSLTHFITYVNGTVRKKDVGHKKHGDRG